MEYFENKNNISTLSSRRTLLTCALLASLLLPYSAARAQDGYTPPPDTFPLFAPGVDARQEEQPQILNPELLPQDSSDSLPQEPLTGTTDAAPAAGDTATPAVPDAPGLSVIAPGTQVPEPLRTLTTTIGPAVLQALDKVSAHVRKLEAPLNLITRFGSLEILVRSCQQAPPEEPAESAAYLEIYDLREGRKQIFGGWMFASSPALSALEHPVYDVWVLECKNDSSSASDSAPAKN
jgi:hypothetical protein